MNSYFRTGHVQTIQEENVNIGPRTVVTCSNLKSCRLTIIKRISHFGFLVTCFPISDASLKPQESRSSDCGVNRWDAHCMIRVVVCQEVVLTSGVLKPEAIHLQRYFESDDKQDMYSAKSV